MGLGKDRAVGRQLRTLFHLGAIGDLSDGQLLERFANARGEGAELAFAALVERHGAMVLRICRSVLDDPHDSDDAFQATFLVLVAKGRSLWVRDSLGPWLHQVATRTARCARVNAARRKRLERSATLDRPEAQNPSESTGEVEQILLEEVARLPERYRAPVVLCDLEGRTHEAAARALGWPVGTVKSRQARARERLKERLIRRGLAPNHNLILLGLPNRALSLPSLLVDSTTRLAVRFVASRAIVPGSAAWLAQEVIQSMSIFRISKIATMVIALGATGSGAVLIAQEPGEGAKKKLEAQVPVEARAKPKVEAEAKPQEPVDETVFTVQPGRLELTETARGNLEPTRVVDLLSEIEGVTTILTIKPEGSKIRKGEVVCELDSGRLRDSLVNQRIMTLASEAAYKQAVLVREVAEYAVKEYREGVLLADAVRLKGKIAGAERAKVDAEARIERAKGARKKLDELFVATKGPATPADIVADLNVNDMIEAAGRSLAEQKLLLELAQGELNTLEKFTSEKMSRQLRKDVEQARSEELNRNSTWVLEQTREKKIERQIERCVLKSAGEGILVYANDRERLSNQRMIEEGASVRERQLICRVVDPKEPLRVNAKFSEALVDQIKVGAKATIKVQATPNETYTGIVKSVAPMADTNALAQQNIKVYTTYIELDKGTLNLRPGMTASATVVLQERDNVLIVPIGALAKFPGMTAYQVDVKTADGKIESRSVVLGLQGGSMVNGKWRDKGMVEIKEGLKAGDKVLYTPESGFQ